MAIALASPAQKASVEAASPNSLAFPNNVTGAGSVCLAAVFWNSNTATMTITDSRSQTWTPLGTVQRGAGGLAAWSFQCFALLSTASGALTVTATASAGTPTTGLHIEEFVGYTGTPTVTGSPVYNNVNGTTVNTSDITTSIAVAMVFAASFPANTTNSLSAPFTDQGTDASWGTGDYGYNIVSSTQTNLHATFVLTSGDAILGIFAIGDAAGGGKAGSGVMGG